MIEGKGDLLKAAKNRKMKVTEIPSNLLETRVHAEGVLDGMEIRVDADCIAGMPGDSMGTITVSSNLAQLLAVLSRVWPAPPNVEEAFSPGRQSWPYTRPHAEKAADRKQ